MPASNTGKNSIQIRTRKLMRNALLNRRQMIVDVTHPGRGNVPKKELQEKLAAQFKVQDAKRVVVFKLKTQYGGGISSGFCLIYDTLEDVKKSEPKHRLVKNALKDKKATSRKQIKESKNRALKIWGVGRRSARHKAKKAK